eukprot:TRINITY_DN3228_c0_g1_i1.p1 TRINITY_DN3228_c0_g1~~TRINITY_DN3228_c0_g1_i1.p1  ORF type:complete len:796 (-),score=182.74 TRINITY_DN3228_c0_g1_i1:58-2106(-)
MADEKKFGDQGSINTLRTSLLDRSFAIDTDPSNIADLKLASQLGIPVQRISEVSTESPVSSPPVDSNLRTARDSWASPRPSLGDDRKSVASDGERTTAIAVLRSQLSLALPGSSQSHSRMTDFKETIRESKDSPKALKLSDSLDVPITGFKNLRSSFSKDDPKGKVKLPAGADSAPGTPRSRNSSLHSSLFFLANTGKSSAEELYRKKPEDLNSNIEGKENIDERSKKSFLRTTVPYTNSNYGHFMLMIPVVVVCFILLFRNPENIEISKNFDKNLTHIAVGLLFLSYVPYTRGSIISSIFPKMSDGMERCHKWCARTFVVLGLLHVFVQLFFLSLPVVELFGVRNVFGILLLSAAILIHLTSTGRFRKKKFKKFAGAHAVCFFLLLVFTCIHYSTYAFQVVVLGIIYAAELVFRSISGMGVQVPAEINFARGKNLVVRMKFRKHCFASYEIGQFIFINFISLGVFEWHPFSIASAPEEDLVEVIIKGLGDQTTKLVQAVESKRPILFRLDGPFGGWHFDHRQFSSICVFCSGSGVTPAFSLLRSLCLQSTSLYPKIVQFVWSCKNETELEVYFQDLQTVLDYSDRGSIIFNYEISIYKQANIKSKEFKAFARVGNPDCAKALRDLDAVVDIRTNPDTPPQDSAILVCGAKDLLENVQIELMEHVEHRSNKSYSFFFETVGQ